VATTPGGADKKLNVLRNSYTANALPTAEAHGHTGRNAMRTAAMISIVPKPTGNRGDAEVIVDPAHQWAVLDEHARFHLHVLPNPIQATTTARP
jgi:hypothetical protein